MENPHTGTEWEVSWQAGYDAGLRQPTGIVSPPRVLNPEQMQVFQEGADAGQSEASEVGTPVELDAARDDPEPSEAMLAATIVLSAAEIAVKVAEGAATKVNVVVAALDVILHLCIPNGRPLQDLSDPAELSQALVAACRAMKSSEVFMPLCQKPAHSSRGDSVLDAGFWHGNLFGDYWAAYRVTIAHLVEEGGTAAGLVGIVHVVTEPVGIEWIELPVV